MNRIQFLYLSMLMLSPFSLEAGRRSAPSAARGLFTRSGIIGRPSLTETGSALRGSRAQNAIQPTRCPLPLKVNSRSLSTETFNAPRAYESPRSTFFESSKPINPGRSRILNAIHQNPTTFIGLTSGIGAATGTGYAYTKYKKYSKKTAIQDNLQRLNYALGHYNPENKHNKKYVYQLLNEFIAEKIINEKDRSGNTPLIIILKAPYVFDEEKAAMLQLLFDKGVQPGNDLQEAIDLALGFDRQKENFETLIKPKVKTFEKLLPFIETPTLHSYSMIAQTQIKNDEDTLNKAQEKLIVEREKKGWKDYLSRRKTVEENNLENMIEDKTSNLDTILNFKKMLDQEIENRLTI